MRMLSEALELEKKGEAFYKEAISTCQNNLGREIFTMLRKEESLHMDRIHKIYKSLKENQTWLEDWKPKNADHKDLEVFFKEMVSKQRSKISVNTSDLDALDLGIYLESQSIAFYKKKLTKAQDSIERDFIKQMIGEENSHHAVLSDMKMYLSDPAGWFFDHEHTGLDGV